MSIWSSFLKRSAVINFWQARLPKWQPNHGHATAATVAFYSAESMQGLGLGGLVKRGWVHYQMNDSLNLVYQLPASKNSLSVKPETNSVKIKKSTNKFDLSWPIFKSQLKAKERTPWSKLLGWYSSLKSAPWEKFEGCPVKSTQIFFRQALWKKWGVIPINQKKIRRAPWKNLVRFYRVDFTGYILQGTLQIFFRVQIKRRIKMQTFLGIV